MDKLAAYIDHTTLSPDTTLEQIEKLCAEAREHCFASVCVPPFYVRQSFKKLESDPVKVSTVIGFPMGYAPTAAKVEEIKRAIDEGADEVDAVINLCALKARNWNYIRNDIHSMITAAHMKGKIIKIILETALLSEEEIRQLCGIALETEPDFVKTSTGFNGGGATLPVVELLSSELKGKIKIKASGGISTRTEAENFIEAGAQRIGSSSGVKIVG